MITKISLIKESLINFISSDKSVGWQLSHHDLSLINRCIENYFNVFDINKFIFNNDCDSIVFPTQDIETRHLMWVNEAEGMIAFEYKVNGIHKSYEYVKIEKKNDNDPS